MRSLSRFSITVPRDINPLTLLFFFLNSYIFPASNTVGLDWANLTQWGQQYLISSGFPCIMLFCELFHSWNFQISLMFLLSNICREWHVLDLCFLSFSNYYWSNAYIYNFTKARKRKILKVFCSLFLWCCGSFNMPRLGREEFKSRDLNQLY